MLTKSMIKMGKTQKKIDTYFEDSTEKHERVENVKIFKLFCLIQTIGAVHF